MGFRRLGLAPRQMLGQRELSRFLEDLAKAAHEELEVPIHLGWVERQNRRQDHRAASVRSLRFGGRFSGARRPRGKTRRPRISGTSGTFEGGATAPGGMPRSSGT